VQVWRQEDHGKWSPGDKGTVTMVFIYGIYTDIYEYNVYFINPKMKPVIKGSCHGIMVREADW